MKTKEQAKYIILCGKLEDALRIVMYLKRSVHSGSKRDEFSSELA